jgi:hypothetical protein
MAPGLVIGAAVVGSLAGCVGDEPQAAPPPSPPSPTPAPTIAPAPPPPRDPRVRLCKNQDRAASLTSTKPVRGALFAPAEYTAANASPYFDKCVETGVGQCNLSTNLFDPSTAVDGAGQLACDPGKVTGDKLGVCLDVLVQQHFSGCLSGELQKCGVAVAAQPFVSKGGNVIAIGIDPKIVVSTDRVGAAFAADATLTPAQRAQQMHTSTVQVDPVRCEGDVAPRLSLSDDGSVANNQQRTPGDQYWWCDYIPGEPVWNGAGYVPGPTTPAARPSAASAPEGYTWSSQVLDEPGGPTDPYYILGCNVPGGFGAASTLVKKQ